MSTPKNEIAPVPQLPVLQPVCERVQEREPNWKLAFAVLAGEVCGGFVDSHTVSRYVEALRRHGEEEAAQRLANAFNANRSAWMQDFMG